MVAAAALEVLVGHRQIARDAPESGGILLGRLIAGSDDVVVDQATRPDPRDLRGRTFFFREREPAQAIVNAEWSQSAGTRIYLGEWHTHSEDNPQSSSQDRRDWREISSHAIYEQNFLLFAIVGRKETAIWEVRRGVEGAIRLRSEAHE